MFFEGDQHPLNPMRYLPTPFHTKFAQQRTALSQYIQQESVGTRMRRWERPIHDFLAPYFRGTVERLTGENIIPAEVEHAVYTRETAARAVDAWSPVNAKYHAAG